MRIQSLTGEQARPAKAPPNPQANHPAHTAVFCQHLGHRRGRFSWWSHKIIWGQLAQDAPSLVDYLQNFTRVASTLRCRLARSASQATGPGAFLKIQLPSLSRCCPAPQVLRMESYRWFLPNKHLCCHFFFAACCSFLGCPGVVDGLRHGASDHCRGLIAIEFFWGALESHWIVCVIKMRLLWCTLFRPWCVIHPRGVLAGF